MSSSDPLSLTASWDAIPVKQQQGKLLGYQVFYTKDGPGNERNGSVGPDQFSYTIKDLEFATYSVRVAGFTAVGIGNSTVVLTKTPNEGGEKTARLSLLMHVIVLKRPFYSNELSTLASD